MNYRHGCAVDWKCGTASLAPMLKGCGGEPPVALRNLCTTVFSARLEWQRPARARLSPAAVRERVGERSGKKNLVTTQKKEEE